MICALSGQSVEVPMVSPNSGKLYEKSVIEAWISAKGTDPVTQTPLTASQLIKLDVSPVNAELVKSSSIPNLLKALQNEFNGIVLENFESQCQLEDLQSKLKAAEETLARLEEDKRLLSEQRKLEETSPQQSGTKRQRTAETEPKDDQKQISNVDGVSDAETAQAATAQASTAQASTAQAVTMPSLEATMKMHLHDVEATAKALSAKRKEFNKYNAGRLITDPPHFREVLREDPTVPLRALGLQVFTGDSIIRGDFEFAFPAANIFWINDTLIGTQEEETLAVSKISSNSLEAIIRTREEVVDVIPHPAGYLLVRTESDLMIYSVYQWLRRTVHPMDKYVSLAIHPDGELIFVALEEHDEIQTYSFQKMLEGKMECIDSLTTHEKDVNMLTASATGYLLAYVWEGVDIGIIDLRYDTPPHVFKGLGTKESPIESLSFDETGLRLIVALDARGVYLLQYAPDSESWTEQHFDVDQVTSAVWAGNEVVALKSIGYEVPQDAEPVFKSKDEDTELSDTNSIE